jgi:hypothetical protein
MKVLVINERKAVKMMKAKAKREQEREHIQWHRRQAESMRTAAQMRRNWLDENRANADPEHVTYIETEIEQLEVAAIEMDNAKCLDPELHNALSGGDAGD